ncbi:Sec1-like family protein [Cavenderia fasciculata]|uniref:Sec1-like family protein n=1 Tax=Cavenderia fasciculata TaxID=261658 RepID=F4PY55_CACFS|nr:Sec1-like family protein [Cavenderia fasciculata]EGG19715.1 Sec1-like family protein [Cavenderia fasciculata]|eukprot:XP_004358009.1 Sec1-like family protein [Cavenderia fasciculata]
MATSLRDVTKKRILDEIIRTITPDSNNGWKALVVDQDALRIISACCQMYDITEEKITVVEKIENQPRQRLPSVEAIYFITPTTKSIDLLINDFKKKLYPQYKAIHLFLTSKLPDSEFKKLSASNAVQRIITFKEMNIEFLANESQVFHFDQKHTIPTLFMPDAPNQIEEQAKIATRLVSLCVSLGEYPIIRYSRNNPVSAVIAGMTQERMDHAARNSKNWNPSDERGTLLILDRSQDPIAPLLHEFTYQAMIYDLFKIENDRFSYDSTSQSGTAQKKEALLSDHDYMWTGLRHKHIADVIEYLKTRLDEFLRTNQVTQYTQQNTGSLKEASDVIRNLPQYQEIMSKYSTHINLAEQSSQKFTEDMANLAYLEQDMATGEDAKGSSPKNIVGRLSSFLSEQRIEKNDKIRLLMMYIISQEGIKDVDRKKLMDLAMLNQQEQSAIANLYYLGVTLMKGAKAKAKTNIQKQRKQETGSVPYEVSRYVPVVKDIAENLINDTLQDTDFPFVRDTPIAKTTAAPVSKVSLKGKSNQPRWADPAVQVEETKYTGSKLIIFIAGGVTYSEMRSIYELSTYYKRNIYIGSTGILLPNDFIDDVYNLKRDP